MMIKKIYILFCLITVACAFLPVAGIAQDNSQGFRFQGISEVPDFMAKASALGNAYTAVTGELPSLYINPAGLADLKKIQVSISGSWYNKKMWESQVWWGGGNDVILVRLWDGVMPLPAREDEGKKAYQIWPNEELPDYNIPTGTDFFDEARADWIHKMDDLGLNSVAAAVPVSLGGKQIVFSGGFSMRLVDDYDQNPARLTPHPGRLPDPYWTSTERIKPTLWSTYERARTGSLNQISAAVALDLAKFLKLGIGYHLLSGTTDDVLSTQDIMLCNMDTEENHEWTFQWRDGKFEQTGTSDFKTSYMDIGTVVQISRLNLGFRVRLNSAITRDWEYTDVTTSDEGNETTASHSGTDKIEDIPPSFAFGVGFIPRDWVRFSFDLEHTSYNKASHNYDSTYVSPDTYLKTYNWSNQTLLRAGLEIHVFHFLSVLAGYQYVPKTWAPFRVAFEDEGQPMHIYSFGASIGVPMGRLDVAYQITRFKYYDAYMYVSPYNSERSNSILFGYTLSL